ncbi:mycorrhiza-upregulated peptidase C14 [Rhizoctonia solani 123E]|uniref:Mycorrhiza-upregulated peptidase C14 n=1 Tax=Rhizoctonia solani 123E TaxID=1423351 RepID=A0A074RU32_9AGAM|nr:mycorrhiza-upregulated peptidase C14 [Rhizoctonia solani 123E]
MNSSPVDEAAAKAIVIENTSKSALYALVIGINSYPNIIPLKGAVNDADEMSNFLTSDLKVPQDHIINLRDESATRAKIIKGFRDLQEDPRIKKGDPILIYYAGHGGSHQPSKQLEQAYGSSKIQVIFPYDYKVQAPDSTEFINCIPDKTIAALLSALSAAKGDNLTVIFDCCHSASATRKDSEDGARVPRGAEVLMEISEDIDIDILPSKPTAPRIGLNSIRRTMLPLSTNQSSHIHFAACGDEEKAWEQNDRGAFTVALLKNIRAHGVDKITYHDLMISLPNLPRQSPHCYGFHTSRILFNARVPVRKIVFLPVKFENGALMLQAGAALGVTYRSVWELHNAPTEDSSSLGRFYAQAPKVSNVELKPEEGKQLPLQPAEGQLYARQVGHGSGNELKVWFSPEAKLAIFDSSHVNGGAPQPGSSEFEVGYVAHDGRDSADVTVELSDSVGTKEVIFHLNDPRAEQYGVANLRERMPARRFEVEKVLFAAAVWHWHLHRTHETARSNVTMELVKFSRNTDGWQDRHLEGGDSVVSVPTNSYKILDSTTGVVDLVVEPEAPYGVKFNNNLNIPLYVRLFYFDPTNFEISSLTGLSVGNARTDPELPARGETIVGRELGRKILFTLNPDVKLELGYFKLFWSTDPLELDIGQSSPFELKHLVGTPGRDVIFARRMFKKDWGTALLALVQRAPLSVALH